MRYLLDTNVCVDYLNGRYPAVVARVQSSAPDDLCLSSVVGELRYGAELAPPGVKSKQVVRH